MRKSSMMKDSTCTSSSTTRMDAAGIDDDLVMGGESQRWPYPGAPGDARRIGLPRYMPHEVREIGRVPVRRQHATTRDDRMATRSAIYPKPPRSASAPLDTVLDRADAEPTSRYPRRGAGDRLIGVGRSFAGRVRSHRQTRGRSIPPPG